MGLNLLLTCHVTGANVLTSKLPRLCMQAQFGGSFFCLANILFEMG
jgi:hypothetical protein